MPAKTGVQPRSGGRSQKTLSKVDINEPLRAIQTADANPVGGWPSFGEGSCWRKPACRAAAAEAKTRSAR